MMPDIDGQAFIASGYNLDRLVVVKPIGELNVCSQLINFLISSLEGTFPWLYILSSTTMITLAAFVTASNAGSCMIFSKLMLFAVNNCESKSSRALLTLLATAYSSAPSRTEICEVKK